MCGCGCGCGEIFQPCVVVVVVVVTGNLIGRCVVVVVVGKNGKLTTLTDTKALSLREISREVVILSLNLGFRPNLFFQTPLIMHDRFRFPSEGCGVVFSRLVVVVWRRRGG